MESIEQYFSAVLFIMLYYLVPCIILFPILSLPLYMNLIPVNDQSNKSYWELRSFSAVHTALSLFHKIGNLGFSLKFHFVDFDICRSKPHKCNHRAAGRCFSSLILKTH